MSIGTQADKRLKAAIRLPAVLLGQGSAEFIETIKNSFDLQDTTDLTVVDQAFVKGDTMLYLRVLREAPLRGKELGKADGVMIMIGGTLTLQFDPKGELSSYTLDDSVEDSVIEAKIGLLKDLENDRIFFAEPGETVDTRKLTMEGKRFYIQANKTGRKYLHRVYL